MHRGASWGIAAAMVLIGLIVVLGALNATAPDPQAIRAELERELEALELIASQDPCRGDLRAEELLRVELYRTEARALFLKLERRHTSLHSIAQLERAAEKEVLPYLARCRDLSPRSHLELERLTDEGRSLLGNYGATRFAAALKESLSVLEDRLADQRTLVSDVFLKLSAETRKASEGGAFSTALRLIEAFQSRFPDHPELLSQLRELRATVLRKAAAECTRLIAEARRESHASQGKNAVKSLESALPQYEGLPDQARIESAIRELRTR